MGMANKSWRKNILRQVNVFYKKARTLASTKLLLNRKAYKVYFYFTEVYT